MIGNSNVHVLNSLRVRLCVVVSFAGMTTAMVGCAALAPAAPAAAPPTSAAAGSTTIVAIAPPAGATPTLWDFLGVTSLCKCLGGAAACELNKLGSFFPGLEPTPAMLGIADPANLNSPNPAVAAAAAAKADEDAAPQKIKALRYLGELGCGGCYPNIEEAILAGLDDCTEAVRYEAAKALSSSSRETCRFCDSSRCCSAKVREKLEKIAYGLRDNNCHIEPSARVRRVARVALANCGCTPMEEKVIPPQPEEGPTVTTTVHAKATSSN